MVDIFKPSDFMQHLDMEYVSKQCAEIANAKLNKLIESWPTVYALANNGQWYLNQQALPIAATNKARLAFIEEIKKEPCSHSVAMSRFGPHGRWELCTGLDGIIRCGSCDVELETVPTWSEKKCT